MGFPGGLAVKNLPEMQIMFDPWVGKIPWRRKWQPVSVFLPEKYDGQRSLEESITVAKSWTQFSDKQQSKQHVTGER